jgi:hypothetical protein
MVLTSGAWVEQSDGRTPSDCAVDVAYVERPLVAFSYIERDVHQHLVLYAVTERHVDLPVFGRLVTFAYPTKARSLPLLLPPLMID